MEQITDRNHPWLEAAENALAHIAALIVGFILMVFGLALGVTMIMLPVGIVVGLLGVAIFLMGLFARVNQKA